MSAEVVTHPAVGVEDRRRWLALAVIVTAQFMVVLDISIVNVALPSIHEEIPLICSTLPSGWPRHNDPDTPRRR